MRWKQIITVGFGLWLVALVYSILVMGWLGIDVMDPYVRFGLDHPKYWLFEAIMTPSYLLFSLLVLRYYFSQSQRKDWQREALEFGLIVMIMQFVLDIATIVYGFGNGWEYFFGLVTITYLTIPGWSYLGGKFWNPIGGN